MPVPYADIHFLHHLICYQVSDRFKEVLPFSSVNFICVYFWSVNVKYTYISAWSVNVICMYRFCLWILYHLDVCTLFIFVLFGNKYKYLFVIIVISTYHCDPTTILGLCDRTVCIYSFSTRFASMRCPLYPHHEHVNHKCTLSSQSMDHWGSDTMCWHGRLVVGLLLVIWFSCCHRNILMVSENIYSCPYCI